MVPLTASLLHGRGRHRLETGLGVSIWSASGVTQANATGILGYRYVSRGGFLFRASLTPWLSRAWPRNAEVVPLFGLSFGKAF